VGRGVPSGKAVAELTECTQGKVERVNVVTSASDLQLRTLPPAAPAGGQARWDRMGWDGMGWDGMGWDGMGSLSKLLHAREVQLFLSCLQSVSFPL